jgi:isopentenyl diphosphate isomerase/L-lactate dehydrogenase-like FMN-dependent dehydrogenase
MNREREFAVMAVELCHNHGTEDAVYQVIMQYGSELKRAIKDKIANEASGDYEKAIDETTLKPTWPLS